MTGVTRKPRIWVIGFGLSGFLPDLIPQFAEAAHIRVINEIFAGAERAARDLLRADEADVFIAAGASGAWLRERLPAPVVQVKVMGFDILHALRRAREVSDRIAIFSYQAISADLEEVKEILKLDIEQCYYTTPEDARARVGELAQQGYKVIVGSSMINRLAEEAGMRAEFLYSESSVRRAIEDAIEIARLARIEETRRDWIDAIVQHLDEAVAAVDLDERIQSLNPAMAALLGVAVESAQGQVLGQLAPELSLAATLAGDGEQLEQIQKIGRRTLVTHRIPIHEHGVRTGAVLTVQDASAIERADRNLRLKTRPSQFVARYRLAQVIGESPELRTVRALAQRYARTDATVLITGASGTGKELLAQGIHNASRRARQPFVAVNCGAFPESLLESELFGYDEGAFTGSKKGGKAGLFESAHTGSIFLDEIGEMPPALQTRLLRVLQEKEVLRLGSTEPTPVDVRVFAATNRNLREAIAAGDFREDLYYRLNILRLDLPPLAARPDDIGALARHLLDRALRRHAAPHLAPALTDLLLPRFTAYGWPGNVRELENVIERIAIFAASGDAPPDEALLRSVVPELFDRPAGSTADLRASSRETERAHIRRVLTECGGNQSEACRRLGIGRTTLWRRLRA